MYSMRKIIWVIVLMVFGASLFAQKSKMTPKQLIELGRVGGMGIDEGKVVFNVSKFSFDTKKKVQKIYEVSINGGKPHEITKPNLVDKHLSPDGKYKIVIKDVKLLKIKGKDYYPELAQSNMMVIDELNYRHWDTWEDGAYSHVMYVSTNPKDTVPIDIMKGERYDCPQKPFGGAEDYLWAPDSKSILYVAKKEVGTAYALSTNSDIFQYDLTTQKTTNLTASNKGYDTSPAFSRKGQLGWLQMKRNGYESDKNDIIVRFGEKDVNLTAAWDGTVNGFLWSDDGQKIFFVAPVLGTVQLFEVEVPASAFAKIKMPRQITDGQFDVNGIVGQWANKLAVSRRDMNHAGEIYSVDITSGYMRALSRANDSIYANINHP